MGRNSQSDKLQENIFSNPSKQNESSDQLLRERQEVNNPQDKVAEHKNNSRGTLFKIFVLLFILIVVAIGTIYFFRSDYWIYKDWWIYQEGKYGYNIKFPPDWKEALGNEYSLGLKQFDTRKKVEKDDPMVTVFVNLTQENQLEEYQSILTASPNDYVVFRDVKSVKVKDVKIDGCNAPMLYTHQIEYGYGPRYDVICVGNKYTISLRLAAGTTDILKQHRKTYERLFKTFKFNSLQCSDPNYKPTPTLSEVQKFLNLPSVTKNPTAVSTPSVTDQEWSEYNSDRFKFLYPSNWEDFQYYQQVSVQEVANQTEPTYNFAVNWDQEKYYDSNLERIKKGNWIKMSETKNYVDGNSALFIEGVLEVDNKIYLRKVYLVNYQSYVYTIDVWNLSTNDKSKITDRVFSTFKFIK